MGILNVTPDSFSDGGKFFDKQKAIEQALKMESEGADFIDIGAESTRPNSQAVSVETELERLVPVVSELLKKVKIPISIDTTKAKVAEEMLKLGVEAINDISGFVFEPKIAEIVAKFNAFAFLMHTKGKPQEMQKNVSYDNLIGEIQTYLESSISFAKSKGIRGIAIDPGIGFGKSFEGNFEILARLGEFKKFGKPILVGLSRKGFLGNEVGERLEGSLSGAVASVLNGANILRVHDVKETKKAIFVADKIKKYQRWN
ncbi:dihydropteroate synthase [bacterium]|nr:dihydropteroate synthase [bacterium]